MATAALNAVSTNAHRDELLGCVTIRYAGGADAVAVSRLAELDGESITGPEILVAEAGGAILAALALTSGTVAADPFRRTSAAVGLLRLRAEQLDQTGRRRRLPRRLLRRALAV